MQLSLPPSVTTITTISLALEQTPLHLLATCLILSQIPRTSIRNCIKNTRYLRIEKREIHNRNIGQTSRTTRLPEIFPRVATNVWDNLQWSRAERPSRETFPEAGTTAFCANFCGFYPMCRPTMGIPVIYLIDTALNRREEDEGRLFSMLALASSSSSIPSCCSVHICAIFLSCS